MMMPSRWKSILTSAVMALGAGVAHADLVYVGSQGNQIRALRLDADSGKLSDIGPVAEGLRPTWTVAHPELPLLYAVNDEKGQDEKGKEGGVAAFSVNRDTGALTKLNEAASGGNGTTYLWLDVPSRTVLTANFASGSATSLALNADGGVGQVVSIIKASGSGPHRRQTSPHAHSVAIDPSGRYALVADLGADRLFVYGYDRATHTLSADDSGRSFVAPPGSGPRHFVFGADGRYVYLLNELTAEVVVLRWEDGRLTPRQTVQTSSADFKGVKSGAEILLSRDGRYLYVEDRGEAALVVYAVRPDTGELTLVQRLPTGGEVPWGMGLHPSGKWLLVAHQRGGKVNLYSVDAATGTLADTGQSVAAPTPVSISFVQ